MTQRTNPPTLGTLLDLEKPKLPVLNVGRWEVEEEFYIAGSAHRCGDSSLRQAVLTAMPFDDADDRHLLYEFVPDRALWTTWADFQKPGMRPLHRVWRARGRATG